MTTTLTPGRALVRWIEAADAALDTAEQVPVDFLRALMARPEKPGRIADGVTWYLQEQIRLMRKQDRDKRPDVNRVGEYELRRWQFMHDRRAGQIISSGLQHNEAIAQAFAFCAAEDAELARQKRSAKPTAAIVRASMVEAALGDDRGAVEALAS